MGRMVQQKRLTSLGLPFYLTRISFFNSGVVTKNHEPQPLRYNEEAEEIEAFVREMAEQTPNITSAIRYHSNLRNKLWEAYKSGIIPEDRMPYNQEVIVYIPILLQDAVCHPEHNEGSLEFKLIPHYVQDDNFAS